MAEVPGCNFKGPTCLSPAQGSLAPHEARSQFALRTHKLCETRLGLSPPHFRASGFPYKKGSPQTGSVLLKRDPHQAGPGIGRYSSTTTTPQRPTALSRDESRGPGRHFWAPPSPGEHVTRRQELRPRPLSARKRIVRDPGLNSSGEGTDKTGLRRKQGNGGLVPKQGIDSPLPGPPRGLFSPRTRTQTS